MTLRKKTPPTEPFDLEYVLLQLSGGNAKLLRDYLDMSISNTPDFQRHDGEDKDYLVHVQIPFDANALERITLSAFMGKLGMELEMGEEGCLCIGGLQRYTRREFALQARIYAEPQILVAAVDPRDAPMSNASVKTWLRQHQKTQKWLAAALEVDYPTVHQWLNDALEMPAYLRKNLALILSHELQKEQLAELPSSKFDTSPLL